MSILQLTESFRTWRDRRTPLVLVTVVATEGSTYSKPGAQMLIAEDADYQGLLSGGCLEGDVVEHAREVFATGRAKSVTYDMRDEDEDRLWGLGLGCNGLMKILLQRLAPDSGYQPFAAISDRVERGIAGRFAVVVESDDSRVGAGAAVVLDRDGVEYFGMTPAQGRHCRRRDESSWTARKHGFIPPLSGAHPSKSSTCRFVCPCAFSCWAAGRMRYRSSSLRTASGGSLPWRITGRRTLRD